MNPGDTTDTSSDPDRSLQYRKVNSPAFDSDVMMRQPGIALLLNGCLLALALSGATGHCFAASETNTSSMSPVEERQRFGDETLTDTAGWSDLLNTVVGRVPARSGVAVDKIRKIRVKSPGSIPAGSVEASGLVWDTFTHSYWLVSDESGALFEMSAEGELLQALEIDGLEMDDAESISIDQQRLFIAGSVSVNKSGVLKESRRKLFQCARAGRGWRLERELDLHRLLVDLSQTKSVDMQTRSYLTAALRQQAIDIEAHQVRGDSLYLGFKAPLNSLGQVVVLKVDGLEALFSGGPLQASIWRSFKLHFNGGAGTMALSDMFFLDDRIYLTGVNRGRTNPASGLWQMEYARNRITSIRLFAEYKAEGVAIGPVIGELTIVFDGGGKTESRYVRIPFN